MSTVEGSMKFTIPTVLVWMLLSAAAAGLEQTLTAEGLARVGNQFLLATDAALRDALRDIARADKQLADYTKKRRKIEREITVAQDQMTQWGREMRAIQEELSRTSQATSRYNQLITESNARVTRLNEAQTFLKKKDQELKDLPAPTHYLTLIPELVSKMDAELRRYEQLASDQRISEALASLNAESRVKFSLGPSAAFKAELPKLRRRAQSLNAAAIKLESDGGVHHVTVILNGNLPVRMVFDSGASVVSITSEIAQQLGLDVPADAPKATLIVADGKTVDATVSSLATVRLGQFVAQDVRCVVLPPSAKDASCLLGQSFLRNFVYRIDPAGGELHLSPVTAETAPDDASVGAGAQGEFFLELHAEISGEDEIDVTAVGLAWSHKSEGWPANVKVNGSPWNPRAGRSLSPRDHDGLGVLREADWLSARIIEKTGRGSIGFEPHADGLRIRLSDPSAGSGRYTLKISLRQKQIRR